MSPSRARSVFAARNPSVVQPSSIGSSGRPTLRIWKKWSITQMESNPAWSASRATLASVGPSASLPPGHVNELICKPTFMAGSVPCSSEQVVGGRDDELAVRALAGGRLRAANQRHGPAGGLAEGQLRGGRELVGDRAHRRPHHAAVGIRLAAEVLERQQPGDAERDVDDAPAPGAAEAVR